MAETSGQVLRMWLLTAMQDLGGVGRRGAVHGRVQEMHGEAFTPEDRAPRNGRAGGEPAWRNNLDSLYDRLKNTGVMLKSQRGDPWRLSSAGAMEAQRFNPSPVAESDLLSGFKPKDSAAYAAKLRGRTLIKSREHEALLAAYGQSVAREGWRPVTTVHPRDLELRRAGQTWLAEVKVVYGGNVTEATRAALAQLLEYRHFFYPNEQPSGLLALFSEGVGRAHEGFLETLAIACVWQAGDRWEGSARAERAGLIPGRTSGSVSSPLPSASVATTNVSRP